MPLDVAQAILCHRSPSTTAIYVQAKTKRVLGGRRQVLRQATRQDIWTLKHILSIPPQRYDYKHATKTFWIQNVPILQTAPQPALQN
jgi:hypothetical protein